MMAKTYKIATCLLESVLSLLLSVCAAEAMMAKAHKVPSAKVHWYGKEGMKTGHKVSSIF
jgi:phosphoribosylaminoimidazole carboxylase (NCAIR synthetase)